MYPPRQSEYETLAPDEAARQPETCRRCEDVAKRLPLDDQLHRLPYVAGYVILSKLGEDGMGIVYHARDTRLDRLVALKMIKPGFADEEYLQRFHREAEAVARLRPRKRRANIRNRRL
jgi:serine/threonine protein kinase